MYPEVDCSLQDIVLKLESVKGGLLALFLLVENMLDTEKLYKILMDDEDLQDIPVFYIMQVAVSVVKAINSGKCIISIWEE